MTDPPADGAPESLDRPHLADTTVWSKARNHPWLAQWFNTAVHADSILTCEPVILELLKSSRNRRSYAEQAGELDLLRSIRTDDRTFRRAREVQRLLSERSQHRGVPPTDLLIAASAEGAGVPLLHYDHDYDLIQTVTGQPMRWVVPQGSIP